MGTPKSLYVWRSTGGCQYCDAMAGYHSGAEPKRPHPNCVCDIVPANQVTLNDIVYEYWLRNAVWKEKRGSRWVVISGARATQETVYAEVDYTIQCLHVNKSTRGRIRIAQKMSVIRAAKRKGEGALRKYLDKLNARVRAEVHRKAAALQCPRAPIT